MNRTDLLITFASCLEKPPEPGTLRGDEFCSDLPGWDSLGILDFISLMRKRYKIVVPPDKIYECQTVDDVIDLVLATVAS